jgi:hypothetical protein
MAGMRDEVPRLAATWSEWSVAELQRQLDELGPDGLWLKAVRGLLEDHGFLQCAGPRESSHELAAWIA